MNQEAMRTRRLYDDDGNPIDANVSKVQINKRQRPDFQSMIHSYRFSKEEEKIIIPVKH